ncbi:MAG TPA: hypothetical protein VHB99_10010, partial [Pirellulales bacterium]|nr:hypothetical protein [Pirellulales bacterium]
ERAAALVDELVAEPAFPQPEAVLIELVASQALEYPEAKVRERAADRTRVAVANQLNKRELPTEEAKRMALAVGRLAPDDRLRARDAQRWLLQRQPAQQQVKPLGRPGGKLTLVREFALPSLDWRAAVGTDHALYATGYRDREVVVVRVCWRAALDARHGQIARLAEEPAGRPWLVEPGVVGRAIMLTAHPFDRAPLVVHVFGHDSFPARIYSANEQFPGEMSTGGHRGLSANSVAAAYASHYALNVADLSADGALVINSFLSSDAQLLGLASLDLKSMAGSADGFSVRLLVRQETLCVAAGCGLSFIRQNRSWTVPLPGTTTQLVGSAPHTRPRIGVAMEQGGLIFWGDHAAAPRTPFASDMLEPRIALTHGGLLVAASKDEIDVYRTAENQLRLHVRVPGNGTTPLAVAPTLSANEFAIVYLGGRVAIHRVSSG